MKYLVETGLKIEKNRFIVNIISTLEKGKKCI